MQVHLEKALKMLHSFPGELLAVMDIKAKIASRTF